MCCRKRLLLRVARHLHYDKVAVGDISSCLAARVLSFMAQGRGAQLPHEMVSDTSVTARSSFAGILLGIRLSSDRVSLYACPNVRVTSVMNCHLICIVTNKISPL